MSHLLADRPLHLFALLAALATLYLGGRAAWSMGQGAASRLGLGPLGGFTLAMALLLATLFVGGAIPGRVFGHTDAALAGALLGALLLRVLARRVRREGPPPSLSLGEAAAVGAAVLGTMLLYAYLVGRYQMHDEHSLFGHKTMVEQLRRGAFPPYLPPFPETAARYHYGFDLLAGVLARAFGLGADLAIDLSMLALCLFMSIAAAAVAVDLGARRSAAFAALAIHFGAGLAAPLLYGTPGRHPRCLIQYHHPTCGTELYPTQLLNVFQHPVSAGVPLFLAALLVLPRVLEPGGDPRRPRLAAALAVLLLGALSLGHFVYFALLALSFLAAALWLSRSHGRPALRRAALVLACALLLALAVGGMLAPSSLSEGGLVVFRKVPGYPEKAGLGGLLWHQLVNLGTGFVLLPLFAWAALTTRRAALLMLVAFATGGILAAQLFTYTRSWDIVKFPSAASFALSLLVASVADRALCARGLLGRLASLPLRASVLVTGLVAAWFLAAPLPPETRPYDLDDWHVDPLIGRSIRWLLDQGYQSRDLVYAQANITRELAIFGGLSVPGEDYDLQTQGVSAQRLQRQGLLLARIKLDMSIEALRELKVRWLVLSDEELANLGPAARARLAAPGGAFAERASFSDQGRVRRVYELLP